MSFQSIRKRSLLFLGGGFLAATLAFAPGAAGAGTAAWAAPQPTAGLDYVALGDSYAVGLGLGPVVGGVAGCGQTTASYPRQLALALELDLTDVTCSGAQTANILDTPQATNGGPNPVQSGALGADTDIVTVTIGGNDLGFSRIIQNCLAGGPAGPLFDGKTPNCRSAYTAGGVDSLAAAVAGQVTSSLTNTLAKINQLAPNAKVFVIGYPALMPDAVNTPADGCFTPFTGAPTAFPFTNIDVAYLHDIQSQLDTAMSTTANTAGATFVPLFQSTLANSPCANNPNAAITGVSFTPDAMHPNVLGVGTMTTHAINAVQATLTAPSISPEATNFDLPARAPVSLPFTAVGFPQPTLAATGPLPDGMNFDNATGVLSGTPTTPGLSTFSLTATNSVSETTEQYTVSVNEAPAITSSTPPGSGTVGTPYSFTVIASGFPAPTFAVSSGALPDGLSIDPASGAISGTPTAAGRFEFTIAASNSAGPAATSPYTVVVAQSATKPPVNPPKPEVVTPGTPGTPTKPNLARTGSNSLLPLGIGGGIVLLTGAGLLLARRFAKR